MKNEPTTIPLNKLLLSPRNVRKTNPDEDTESFADDIEARGLLHNLVVSPSPTGRGFYEVDAGGRRWRALQILVGRRKLARDWPVPVKIIPRDEATEASLAENLHTIAMNPADEYDAFATIIAGYEEGGVADGQERVAMCARRFGKTARHVEQRLRLAALAPQILEALRTSRITVDAAKAYAGHPDRELQLKIFAAEEKKGSWGHSPTAVRDAIKGRVYMTDHPAALYVGLDAYAQAGGRVEKDLFLGAEDREVLLDPAIVDRLAAAKAEREAAAKAHKAGFAEAVVKPWNSGSPWSDPKPPKGFRRVYDAPAKAERAEAAMAFRIADNGRKLEPIECWYVPDTPGKPAATYGRETEEERRARERKARVEIRAARLAAPSFEGTPLEGRTFWPPRTHWIDAVTQEPNGDVVLALLVRVPAADVAAMREKAEWELAEEEANAEAGEAAQGEPAEAGEGGDAGAPEVAELAELAEVEVEGSEPALSGAEG